MPVIRSFSNLLILPVIYGTAVGASSPHVSPDVSNVLSNLPVRFEQNAGQHNSSVKYTARGDGYSLFLTGRDVIFVPSGPGSKAVTISLLHGNTSPSVEGVDQMTAKASYFTGNRKQKWATGVGQFSRVRYSSVYPGVDLVYYGTGRQLEYDFIVRAGADAKRIQMKFSGADVVRLTADGDLMVSAGAQELKQKKPVAYQTTSSGERREIACRFQMKGNNVAGFELGDYDHARELVIDPPLVYASYLGGSRDDAITGIATDLAGNIYVAGYTYSNDVGAADGAYQSTPGGDADIFIAKLNKTSTGASSLVALTYIGGTGADIPTSMVLGADGNLYLTGSTTSSNFPTVGNAVQSALSGTQDAFVLRIPRTLDNLEYSTYLGGGDVETGYGITVDSSGVMYVTGGTQSSDFPVSGNPAQSGNAGGRDAFVTKLDPAQASVAYSTYLGGERTDEGRSIVVTPAGLVYVTGWTSSTGFPTAGNAYQGQSQGGGDIFITGIDTSRGADGLVYSTYLGGTGDDDPRKMILESSGTLLLTGVTLSKDFPTSAGAVQPTQGGSGNAFVVRFDPGKTFANGLQYSTYLGGTSGDVGRDIATDASGMVYVTGYTFSSDFPVTAQAVQPLYGGGCNAFVTKLDLSIAGAPGLLYSTYLGGRSVNIGYALTVPSDGLIYVGGFTRDTQMPMTDGGFATTLNGTGSSDGFVIVLDISNQS